MQSLLFYKIIRAVLRLVSALLFRVDVVLHSELPNEAAIYIANHPSATDPFILHRLARMSILITATAFAFPLAKFVLNALRQIKATPGQESLSRAQTYLKHGQSIGIFPEGANSPSEGGFAKFHTGAARLALKSGAPVVPVGIYLLKDKIRHTFSQRKGRDIHGFLYLKGPYVITVGEPMIFQGDPEDHARVNAVKETMHTHLYRLEKESEQRYLAKQQLALPYDEIIA